MERSLVTVGINVVANVREAIAGLKQFGVEVGLVGKQVDNVERNLNRSMNSITSASARLRQVLTRDWGAMAQAVRNGMDYQAIELKRLEREYDRSLRQVGNQFQSLVMASVALSMAGFSLRNWGQTLLGFSKTALDTARDFEMVMAQIQFYGGKTAEEMERLQRAIFEIDRRVPATTTQVAEAVLGAQKTGYNYEESLIMGEKASTLAFLSMGELDGETALKYLAQMQRMTNAVVGEAERGQLSVDDLMDKIIMTADVSAASIESLWRTIQSSRTAFQNLHTDIDTMLTLSAVMSNALNPRMAGMALSSFARGINMAEKAWREGRGTRGAYYAQLVEAMGGRSFDDFGGDIVRYLEAVVEASYKVWEDGTERTGNLISIFGREALDLFIAYEQYAQSSLMTMDEMRDRIRQSDGHAQKLFDTLMNTSYGTEMLLESVTEQFQILFGQTIRPLFNSMLKGLSDVLEKVNEFIMAHPKLAKALGYGIGIAGLLLTATGASMMFVGAISAIYSSLGNMVAQLARNLKLTNLLARGYATVGQALKGQFMIPLRLAGKQLLRFSAITFFVYTAWKNDFLRIRTTFTNWLKYIRTGLNNGQLLFKRYGELSAKEWQREFMYASRYGALDNWVTSTYLKVRILADALRQMWKEDGTLDIETYWKLQEMGLIGFVEKVWNVKTAVEDLWKGFMRGLGQGLEFAKDALQPLLDIFSWIWDKVIGLLQRFGYFEDTGEGISKQWEKIGFTLGDWVGKFVAIRLAIWGWVKGIKLLLTPFRLIFSTVGGIWGVLKKIGKFFKGGGPGGKGGPTFTRRVMGWMGLGPVYDTAKGIQKVRNKRASKNYTWAEGASQPIPYMTQSPTGSTHVDPKKVPKTPLGWWLYRRRAEKQPIEYGTRKSGVELSKTKQGRGPIGRLLDWWYGPRLLPKEVEVGGKKQYRVEGPGGISTWTDEKGRVKGRYIRTGTGASSRFAEWRQRTGQNVRERATRARTWFGETAQTTSMVFRRAKSAPRRAIDTTKRGFSRTRDFFKGMGEGGFFMFPPVIGGDGTVAQKAPKAPKGRGLFGLFGKRGAQATAKATATATAGRGVMARAGGVVKGAGRVAGGLFGGIGKIFGGLFKGAGGIAKLGGKLGGGILKGLGAVLFSGIPALFKGLFKAIPIIGWAMLIWDAVSLIFSNWDSIKEGAINAWNWIKTEGVRILGEVWNWVSTKAVEIWNNIPVWASIAWEWIKTDGVEILGSMWGWLMDKGREAWDWVRTDGVDLLGELFNWVLNTAWDVFTWIVTEGPVLLGELVGWIIDKAIEIGAWLIQKAPEIWEFIKDTAVTLGGVAWDFIKQKGAEIWEWIKEKGRETWEDFKLKVQETAQDMLSKFVQKIGEIKTNASEAWEEIKQTAKDKLSNMFQPIKDAWEDAKRFVANNPITQTVRKVVTTVGGAFGFKADGSHRSGLWEVPKDGYRAILHRGEMVLTKPQAEILRRMVGSKSNSIERFLLDQEEGLTQGDEGPSVSVKSRAEKVGNMQIRPIVRQQSSDTQQQAPTSNITVQISEGAIQVNVQNATATEAKRFSKQILEEIKREIELQNLRHYKPARPRF